ncbi:MAG: hypothetical protein E3J87_07965 [Candidatus Cloacimonadota bacterium]|nr:MAG: hypothetical protein E3J87_07965 [Candidatus Cloacimonadota bacterium]
MYKTSVITKNRAMSKLFKDEMMCPVETICPTIRQMQQDLVVTIVNLQRQATKVLLQKKEKMRQQVRQISEATKNILGRNFEAYSFFANEVSRISQVYAVYATVRENIIDLWTIVEKDLYKAEGLVIDVQLKLLRKFPDLSFDFLILSKNHQKLQEIIPSNSIQIYLRYL